MEFRDMPKPQQPIDASDVIKMNGEGYLPGQIPSCCNCKQNIIPENLKMENVISEE